MFLYQFYTMLLLIYYHITLIIIFYITYSFNIIYSLLSELIYHHLHNLSMFCIKMYFKRLQMDVSRFMALYKCSSYGVTRCYATNHDDTPKPSYYWFILAQIFDRLRDVYKGDIDNLDLWPAGLLETTGSGPGPVFTAIILDQFRRIRKGDRFWYENYELNK